jgi:hypothetical protein
VNWLVEASVSEMHGVSFFRAQIMIGEQKAKNTSETSSLAGFERSCMRNALL